MLNIKNFLKKLESIDLRLSMLQKGHHDLFADDRKNITFFRHELQKAINNIKAFSGIE